MTALNEREAAKHVRLSVNSFRKAVKAGKIPPPADLGVRRRLWHPAALDAALLGRVASVGAGAGAGAADDREQRKAAWKARRQRDAG
jgi:predicted DNA-binding transcriptional regulator AlpA